MTIADIFLQIVQIDSPSGREGEIKEFVIKFCAERGIALQEDDFGNLYFTCSNSRLLLMSHLDTVQGDSHVEPVLENGVIRSNGKTILGADDKCSVAAMLQTVEDYHQTNRQPDFELLFTVQEELGIKGAKAFDFKVFSSKNAISFDKDGHPFGTIVSRTPFGLNVILEVKGKSAHASLPENGINALVMAAEIIIGLPIGGKNNETTFNFGLIEGGETSNTVPAKVVLKGDIRSLESRKAYDLGNEVRRVAREVVDKYRGAFSLSVETVISGYQLDENDGFVKQIRDTLAELGTDAEFIAVTSGSDVNIAREFGINGVVLASGATGAHTYDEQLAVSDLENISKLLNKLLA